MNESQTTRVILHADDFGQTIDATTDVLRCIERGVITSVTAMANMSATEHALASALAMQDRVSIGVHLNLCEGRPLTKASTLVDDAGSLFGKRAVVLRALLDRFSASDLERECTAQIARVSDAGITVSHIDGHKHLHLIPGVAEIVARIAKRFGVERVRCPVHVPRLDHRRMSRSASALSRMCMARLAEPHFTAAGLRHPDRLVDVRDLIRARSRNARINLLCAPALLTEVMCHPPLVASPESAGHSNSTSPDSEFLLSEEFAGLLAAAGVTRCSYWDC